MIQVKHISKHYGQQAALSDVSFSLDKGEITGLLGVNGAGKSTLMKIMAGIIEPNQGEMIFLGENFSVDSQSLKQKIGYLSEDNPLYDDMYVKEYLYYVADIYNIEKARAGFAIEKTELGNEYRKKIKELSKGNRQRVGIAQSLINSPKFLILDEATSGLDPNQRNSISDMLLELSKETTILFSTHILQEVKDICSRLILLDKGLLVADQLVDRIESIEKTFHTLTNENNSR